MLADPKGLCRMQQQAAGRLRLLAPHHAHWLALPAVACRAAAGECYLVLLLCAATMGLLLPPQAHRAMDAPRAAAAPAAPPLLPRPPPQQQQRFRGSSNSRSQFPATVGVAAVVIGSLGPF
eukprot:COSAG01_NODE_283_length_19477_cov_44.267468_12_plen_121_part_00